MARPALLPRAEADAVAIVAIGSLVAALWAIGDARAEEQRMLAAQ